MAESPDVDTSLIRRIARGERDALADLHARYRLPLFRYLLGLSPDWGLAEELLQDTLVAVWKSARSFKGQSSVRTWVFGIARRQAYNTLRRRGTPVTDLVDLDDTCANEPGPEDILLTKIAYDHLLSVMGRLAPAQREVLVLTFVNELSYQESAAVMGVPIGTVKSRLNKARHVLRSLLCEGEKNE
jgi:RNA polymerase sigma-70 factor (ECF subfamily)